MASLVQIPSADGRSTLKLFGTLDAEARPGLADKLFALAESEDTTIDLAPATSIDLGSVRMLVSARERARLSGRLLEIVNAPAYVERMLQMLDHGHYWRPEKPRRRGEGEAYEPPLRTTADAQRSRPESMQIVRLQCASCGQQTFRPESSAVQRCDTCGSKLEVVAVFRDRRRTDRPVDHDRRAD